MTQSIGGKGGSDVYAVIMDHKNHASKEEKNKDISKAVEDYKATGASKKECAAYEKALHHVADGKKEKGDSETIRKAAQAVTDYNSPDMQGIV